MTADVQELVRYNQMCRSIAECYQIDEVASIKDQAAKLEAYAKMADNPEAERQFAEVKLRACIRIGEISKELEKAQPNKGHGSEIPNDGKTKEEQLNEVGISTSTAQRYEQLTGGRQKQAQKTAEAATEAYFSEAKQKQEPITMGGLQTAVKHALDRGEAKISFDHEPKAQEVTEDEKIIRRFKIWVRALAEEKRVSRKEIQLCIINFLTGRQLK
jgi:predicted DsbA family dithiol-disulfide isomerase